MNEDFTVEIVDGIAIVKLNMMRATIKEAQEFKKTLQSVFQNGNHKIIINFSECSFVDSSIVGVIVTFSKELKIKGGEIKSIIQEGTLLNLFTQTGLEKIIRHYPNRETALASFTHN